MRRALAVSRAALVLTLLLGAASTAFSAAIDLVVMMDTSESMFPYFDDLRTYLMRDLLKQKLHRGDTFHLLSFASTPELETAVELSNADAAERAFARLDLLHPLGRYTDLIAALRFLHTYVRQLPEKNPKTILILTDGIHDPPPGSPWQLSGDEARAAIREAATAIGQEGWTVQLLQVPAKPEAAAGEPPSYIGEISEALGAPVTPYDENRKTEITGILTGYPTVAFPDDLGKVGRRFIAPFTIRNYRTEPILVRLAAIQEEGIDLLERAAEATVPADGAATLEARLRLPLSFPVGFHDRQVHLVFAGDARISPVDGALLFTYTGRGGLPLPQFNILYVPYLLAAAAIIYVLVRLFLLMRRKLREVSLEGLARATTDGERESEAALPRRAARPHGRVALMNVGDRKVPWSERSTAPERRVTPTVESLRGSLPAAPAGPGALPPLVEMRVSLQNPHIGMRNVHRILPGASRTIGGRASAFLIFLVRVPRAIATLRNDDGCYTFAPVRSEFFPDVKAPVTDCLGKEIPFVGPMGQPMSIRFRQWVSALDEINALMRSVRREPAGD